MAIGKNLKSIRFVLTLWYTMVLLAAFVIFGGSVYIYLKHLQEQTLEQDLSAEVDWIYQLIYLEVKNGTMATRGELPAGVRETITRHFKKDPRNYIVSLSTEGGRILYESEEHSQEYLSKTPVKVGQTLFLSVPHQKGGRLRVASLSRSALRIQVAFPERHIQNVLDHILSILALLTPVVLLISFAGGWLLAGLALSPVGEITRRAARITAQNLNERIPPRDVDDELGRLITTINYMIARLDSSFEQMKQFSMNVAHELRTPLTILRGEAELALDRTMTQEELRQFAGVLLEETGRMAHVIDDLLTLAKAESGTVAIRKEPVNIEELILDLFDDAQMLAAKKNLTVTLPENRPARVIGDQVRLRQLFRGLISNAMQYTDARGTITIRSNVDRTHVHVSVEDTGIGIPPESLDKIFARFYRVDEARSRDTGGSGLGLAIAKWIVDAHGGTISVRSTVGIGSTFTVSLPLGQ